jgi:hypothetical protein
VQEEVGGAWEAPRSGPAGPLEQTEREEREQSEQWGEPVEPVEEREEREEREEDLIRAEGPSRPQGEPDRQAEVG